jgi:hypothetical protein
VVIVGIPEKRIRRPANSKTSARLIPKAAAKKHERAGNIQTAVDCSMLLPVFFFVIPSEVEESVPISDQKYLAMSPLWSTWCR